VGELGFPAEFYDLTQREREVALYVAVLGRQDKNIAHELGLAVGTISQRLKGVYRKMGVRNRNQLAMKMRDAA
jgi:DNA-binding NarL/FixJ family response regulator